MFRIAIVEDQEETRECLNRFVRQYAKEQGIQVEISLIADGSEIAEHYAPGFDIIFMDVEMPGWTALALPKLFGRWMQRWCWSL